MKKSDKITYQQKDIPALKKDLADLKKQLIETKAQHALGKLKDTSKLSKTRYLISLVSTLINQKQNDQK